MQVQSSTTRWDAEAAFFDRVAADAEAKLRPVSPAVRARYSTKHRTRFAAEYRFRMVGDLRDKRVLDVGCGDGANSSLLALMGARVEGVDISPGAIALARRRAEINGVEQRVSFHCSPIEMLELESGFYDVVWCDAILHHLIPDIAMITERFRRWVRPGGVIVMTEPVNLSPALRRLRFAVARDSEHTDDERPLEPSDLETIRRVLPGLTIRYFRALGRLERYIFPDHQYETAAAWRKAAHHAVSLTDAALLAVPGFERTASVAVMVARG